MEDRPTNTIKEVSGECAEPRKFVFKKDFTEQVSCTGSISQFATALVVEVAPVRRPPINTLFTVAMVVIEVTESHAKAYWVYTSPVL